MHHCTTVIEEASRRTHHHSPWPVRTPETGDEARWEQPLGSTTGAASGAVVRLHACTYLGGVSRGCWGVASRPNEGDVVQDLLRKSVRQCRCHTPAEIQHTAIAIRPECLGEGLCRTDRKCICYCAIAVASRTPRGMASGGGCITEQGRGGMDAMVPLEVTDKGSGLALSLRFCSVLHGNKPLHLA